MKQHAIESGSIKKSPERASKIVALSLAGSLAVAALSGCSTGEVKANQDSPSPSPTSSSSEATPTPTTTTTPEKQPMKEHHFSGVIDLDTYSDAGWGAVDLATKVELCNNFFNNNIENRQPLSPTSTGIEIAQSYKDRVLVLQDLALDMTDPRYGEAVYNIANFCVASNLVYSDGKNPAAEELNTDIYAMRSGIYDIDDGYNFTYIEPDKINAYSDGTYPAQTDMLDYYAEFAIQGNHNFSASKSDKIVQYFKWVPDMQDYSLVRTARPNLEPTPLGPNPPIKVGPGY